MPISGRILSNPVTLRRATTTSNRGTRVRAYDEAAAVCSIQPMRGDRQQLYGLEAGVTLYTAYFGFDPQLRPNDEIAWQGVTHVVLSTANDQAGRGVAWTVDCKVIAPTVRT